MELLLNKLSSTYEYDYAAISKDLTHLGKVTPIQTQTDSGFDISHVVDQLLAEDTIITTETQKEPTDKELEDNYR